MKVLLIGEFSSVHSELAKGLIRNGIEVTTVSSGDGFKNYKSDVVIHPKRINSMIWRKIYALFFSRTGYNNYDGFKRDWPQLKETFKDYDVVQFINPNFLPYGPKILLQIAKELKKNNQKMFLCVLGWDYYVLKDRRLTDKNPNPITDKGITEWFRHSVYSQYKYTLGAKRLNDYLINSCSCIIPGLYEYYRPYMWSNKITDVIPFPIGEEKIGKPFTIKDGDKIVIFHGWQKGREREKGNDVYDKVIRRVVEKYGPERVEYKMVQSVPYDQYVKLFNDSHIFIDQLYSHSYGVNAVLGMAAGKVVFSGLEAYQLKFMPNYHGERIGIQAEVREDDLFKQFCDLIENPLLMNEISRNAIDYVRHNHSLEVVAKMYLSRWDEY